jgi:hypothetical protein
MPLKLNKRTAVLTGTVSVEEAGDLAEWFRNTPAAELNLRDCSHLHTAALQAMLAARPRISQNPVDDFLLSWVMPLLTDIT